MKIFVSIFSTETIVFGCLFLLAEFDMWPAALHGFEMPNSVALTVALFSILVYALSHMKVVRAMTNIADRFFQSSDMTEFAPLAPAALRRSRATTGDRHGDLPGAAQSGLRC